MPSYRYIARNQFGAKVEGQTDAATEPEAVAVLTHAGLFPIEIKPVLPQAATGKVRRVKGRLLAGFYSQLADLLKSGVPLLKSLKILQEQTADNNLKYIIDSIYRRVEAGETLAEAMGRYHAVFGDMCIQMVLAGGEGGFLEESLNHIADYTEAQDELKNKITEALTYPVLLLTVMILVITGMMLFIVPQFEGLFADLRRRGELPLATEILLLLSGNMPYALMVAVPVLLLGLIWYHFWSNTHKGRRTIDRFKLRFPVAGNVYEGFAIARFCRILGTLLRNGVPIVKSLEISGKAAGNKILSDAVVNATENISGGSRLADPLAKSGCFPRTVVEMISVAEEANTLDAILVKISDSLERRNWRTLGLAVKLIEPLMLAVLAVLILFLMLSLLLPLFKMAG